MGNAISYANGLDRYQNATQYSRLFPAALPGTDNEMLVSGGYLALYNPAFIIGGEALLMHSTFFGLFAVLRGFSAKRMLDLHYLSIVFAFTFVMLPIYFLFDLNVDQPKLCFFLEHVMIEFLIAARVLAPAKFVAERPGLILLIAWFTLVAASVVVIGNHAALFVIGSAFVSDFSVAMAGVALVMRYWQDRNAKGFAKRKRVAEAVSGVGFILHGITTMTGGPLAALILYGNYHADAFGIEWAFVFMTGLLAQGLQVPVAALFFNNISCCCGHRRKVFPGQVEWQAPQFYDQESIPDSTMKLKGDSQDSRVGQAWQAEMTALPVMREETRHSA